MSITRIIEAVKDKQREIEREDAKRRLADAERAEALRQRVAIVSYDPFEFGYRRVLSADDLRPGKVVYLVHGLYEQLKAGRVEPIAAKVLAWRLAERERPQGFKDTRQFTWPRWWLQVTLLSRGVESTYWLEDFRSGRDVPLTWVRVLTDFDLAGKATCGCVYHAEDGVPCVHDLALAKANDVISSRDYAERMARLHPVPVK